MDSVMMRRKCAFISIVLVFATAVGAQEADNDQVPEIQYSAEIIWCRIDGGMELLRVEEASQAKLESILDNPVSIEFDDIHLSFFAEFLSDKFDLNILIDDRVVAPAEKSATSPEVGYDTDGRIPYVNLQDISLRTALKAVLRPLGLDYRVVPQGFIWVTTPERLRSESFSNLVSGLREKGVVFRDSGKHFLFGDEPIFLGTQHIPDERLRELSRYSEFEILARPNITIAENQPATLDISTEIPLRYLEMVSENDDTQTVRKKTGFFSSGMTVDVKFWLQDKLRVMMDFESRTSKVPEPLPANTVYWGKPSFETARHELKGQAIPTDKWFSVLTRGEDDDLYLYLMKVHAEIPSGKAATVEIKALHVAGDYSESGDKPKTVVLSREDLDLDALPGFTKIRKSELVSAPRTTTRVDWDKPLPAASTLFKIVMSNATQRGGSGGFGGGRAPGGSGFSGFEDTITSFAPPGHDPPVKMEDMLHSVIMLDIGEEDIEYRPHTQSPARDIERITTKVGTLTKLRVEETNGEKLRVWYTYAARWNRLDGPKRTIGKETADAQHLYATTNGGVMLGPDEVSVTVLPLDKDEYAVVVCEVTPDEQEEETAQIQSVAVSGNLIEYRGALDPIHLENAVRIDASGTLDNAAYFVPVEDDFGKWIQALGTPDHEPWTLSSPRATMLVDWKRWIAINEALSMANIMMGGSAHDSTGVFRRRVIGDEHWTRLEEAMQRSIKPGGTGMIDINSSVGRGVITGRIDLDTPKLNQKTNPLTRKGEMAVAYQVDSHVDNRKYHVWVGLQFHLAGRDDIANAAARYVQAEFEADVVKGQPYALVMPMGEREYLLYAMEFDPLDATGRGYFAPNDR